MARDPVTHMLWLDLECSGGEPETDRIMEIGFVLTTLDLEPIVSYERVVNPAPFDWQKRLEAVEVVMNMHVKNGLVGDLLNAKGISARGAEQEILDLLGVHVSLKARSLRLAGGGVCHFDRKFIRAELPRLDRVIAHPCHDVGDMRRFIHQTCNRPDLLADYDPKTKAHRSLADAQQHLQEARHYQAMIRAIA
jgi:oligoribonuclease (3'-5' exoribonuclease)